MAGSPAAAFDLFGAEERTLADAEALLAQLASVPDGLREGIASLIIAYRRGVREQRRLVKVSDRQQAQLAALNQELARRSDEAQDALARLKETQDNLVQAEKLASLGALVAGIAHEINTPVGIALSCASHLGDATARIRGLFEADDVGVEDFGRYMEVATEAARLIQANCERAAVLIGSFKQVAVDRASAERRQFDLATVIGETLASLGPRLKQAGHRLSVDCPAGLAVDSYPGALSQILTNLVMNSLVHAYDDGVQGIISLAVRRGDEGMIRIRYADDGKGIPAEHRNRVFDPFFTTRRGSGGSGLGLHLVYNLITGTLQGGVTVDGREGEGAVFTLVFPAVLPQE